MYLDDDVGVPGLSGGHHSHGALYHVQLALQFILGQLGLYQWPDLSEYKEDSVNITVALDKIHLPDIFLSVLGKQRSELALLLHAVRVILFPELGDLQSPGILHRPCRPLHLLLLGGGHTESEIVDRLKITEMRLMVFFY